MTAMQASEGFIPFVQKLERSSWQHTYMFFIIRTIQSDVNYQLVRCFSYIQDASYGERFLNFVGPDGFTTLSTGVFCWLINIRPGYLVFRQGDTCTIEPYMSSRLARKFGYDQLYVGNPNTGLRFRENLFEAARAWYFNVAGGAGATFSLPQRTPNSYTSLSFCT